jgi:hypothetical protein
MHQIKNAKASMEMYFKFFDSVNYDREQNPYIQQSP